MAVGTVRGAGQSLGAFLLQEEYRDLGFVGTSVIVNEKAVTDANEWALLTC